MVEVRQRDDMLIGIDDAYLPLMISTFRGNIDVESARWHDEIVTKTILGSAARGRRVVHVVDAREVETPSAQLRRFWADRISQSIATIEAMLGVFVVIDNPALRGAMTAISWLCNEARRVEHFPSLRHAIELANLRFQAAGYPAVQLYAEHYTLGVEEAPQESYQTTKPGALGAEPVQRQARRRHGR